MTITKYNVSLWDYLTLTVVFGLSLLIGFYHACTGGKQKTTDEFFMANRNMNILPLAMSMVASSISATMTLGLTSDIYVHNTMFSLYPIGTVFAGIFSAIVYIPVFHQLKLTSVYEYLESRFNRGIRHFGSVVYICCSIFFASLNIYAPALVVNQVLGFNLWASMSVIIIVCLFYTTMGGIKAVVWTDVFQTIVMYSTFICIIIVGCSRAGGAAEVWRRNMEGNRIEFLNYNPDPRERHTIWSVVIGGSFNFLSSYGTTQHAAQRILATNSVAKARMLVWIHIPSYALMLTVCTVMGMLIYATYWDCDPLTMKYVQAPDQLLPYFIVDALGDIPGLTGLFVGGLFSACLSTLSTLFNSAVAVMVEDFVRMIYPNISEKAATTTSKCLCIFCGIVCMGCAALVQRLGGILQAGLSVLGTLFGPLVGVFTLGMLFPSANSLGAVIGILCGSILTLWIGIGGIINKPNVYSTKTPVSIEGCDGFGNSSFYLLTNLTYPSEPNTTLLPEMNSDSILDIYKISYMWYSMIGVITSLTVGYIASLIFGDKSASPVDSKLLCQLYKMKEVAISEMRITSKVSVLQTFSTDDKVENCSYSQKEDIHI